MRSRDTSKRCSDGPTERLVPHLNPMSGVHSDLHPGSFRDPSGFIFVEDGRLLRQVNRVYESHYRQFAESGAFDALIEAGLLIPSVEADIGLARTADAALIIEPQRIPFISYPYEWCFSQLKAAALATLEIQKEVLKRNFVLKDASAYNIQFNKGRPIHIDTLSFEPYEEGSPWVAYRQFCQHFLAPLLLMNKRDVRLGIWLRDFIDGFPLDLASELLPRKTRFNFQIAAHIHLHAKVQTRAATAAPTQRSLSVNRNGLVAMIDGMISLIRSLSLESKKTTWSDYYSETNYSQGAMQAKKTLVSRYLDSLSKPISMVWDLGSNVGEMSDIASKRGIPTIGLEMDPYAVEEAYRRVTESTDEFQLPLVQDLSNPSPRLGWAHEERESLLDRGPADVAMALALVHHLAIGNNVPLSRISEFMAQCARHLIIEFVPKEDSQIQRMLSTRKDVFDGYSEVGFESAFDAHWILLNKERIEGTARTLYLLERKAS